MDGPILIAPLVPAPDQLADSGLRIGLAVIYGFLLQRLMFMLVSRGESWIGRLDHGRGQAGFGAQTLVRDVIAGVVIIAEDQFGVGDLIEVNVKAATVEALTVRCTTLRDFNGFLHFVPNGEMKVVVNRSRGWNRLAVDVPVAPDEDVDRALETCQRAAAAMSTEPAWKDRLLDEIRVWGVGLSGPKSSRCAWSSGRCRVPTPTRLRASCGASTAPSARRACG